jgi:hypothetical protein
MDAKAAEELMGMDGNGCYGVYGIRTGADHAVDTLVE